MQNPDEKYAGAEHVVRDQLASGEQLFGVEPEGEISKALKVVPTIRNGVREVSTMNRLAHNVAVNHLRRKLYNKATLLDADNTAITTTMLSETVLDQFNSVLDPEDRVNGAVDLEMAAMELPVKGLGVSPAYEDAIYQRNSNETEGEYSSSQDRFIGSHLVADQDPDNLGHPDIFAQLGGADAGSVSLKDFYNAQKMDGIIRSLAKIVEDNPEKGEAMVANIVHGLNIDVSAEPFVIFNEEGKLESNQRYATNGADLDNSQTDLFNALSFSAAVPKTEFGYVVVTFAYIKPDEVLADRPHPVLSKPWGSRNYLVDEFNIDPVPVALRDLSADEDITPQMEATTIMYTGRNEPLRRYKDYGFTALVDPTEVATKTALWQHKVPVSVTPDNILYPDDLDHYPFSLQTDADACDYVLLSRVSVNTPLQYGPTPVENIQILDDEPSLIDGDQETQV